MANLTSGEETGAVHRTSITIKKKQPDTSEKVLIYIIINIHINNSEILPPIGQTPHATNTFKMRSININIVLN